MGGGLRGFCFHPETKPKGHFVSLLIFFLSPIELGFKQLPFRVVRDRADHQLGAGGAV